MSANKPMVQLKKKATSSFAAAKKLAEEKNYNGAANRAYYTIYQALTGVLTDADISPEDWDVIIREDNEQKRALDMGLIANWRHSYITQSEILKKQLLAFSRSECFFIKTVLEYRAKANYSSDEIGAEVVPLVARIPALLRPLGVNL